MADYEKLIKEKLGIMNKEINYLRRKVDSIDTIVREIRDALKQLREVVVGIGRLKTLWKMVDSGDLKTNNGEGRPVGMMGRPDL